MMPQHLNVVLPTCETLPHVRFSVLISYRNIRYPIPKIGEAPPKEFCILPKGKLSSVDGLDLIVDDESMSSIMQAFKDHGIDFEVDWEHASEAPASEVAKGGAPAAAWGRLDARSDGIWLTDIRWVPPADEQVRTGGYRWWSPVVNYEKETGRVVVLRSAGLTNLPALDNLTPLMAAKDTAMATEKAELKDMGLSEHAKAMKEHMDAMKEDSSDRKDMHGEMMKALKELVGCMKDNVKAAKAKDDDDDKDDDDKDDDDKDDDDDESEEKMKALKDAMKGKIDAAVGLKLTPGDAREFKAKLDKGEITPEYVDGYLSAAKDLVKDAPATAPSTSSKVRFDDAQIAKCKSPAEIKKWDASAHKPITTASEAEAYMTKVCKASGIDVDKVAKSWAESVARYESAVESGILKGLN